MKRRIWIGILASILLALSHEGLEAQVQVGGQLLHNEEITGGSMAFGARSDTPRHIMGGIRLNTVGRTTPYLEVSYRNGDELGDQVVASLGILF